MEELLKEILKELKQLRNSIASPKAFLSKQEVAEMLDISISTVDRLTQKGVLKHKKIGNRTVYSRTEVLQAI